MEDTRECLICKGKGCSACDFNGSFGQPSFETIAAQIIGRNGLVSRRPKYARAYFVWRMARFHGGKDVTMPIMAETLIWGDPYDKELDKMAGLIAKMVYGTDMAGAKAWARVL